MPTSPGSGKMTGFASRDATHRAISVVILTSHSFQGTWHSLSSRILPMMSKATARSSGPLTISTGPAGRVGVWRMLGTRAGMRAGRWSSHHGRITRACLLYQLHRTCVLAGMLVRTCFVSSSAGRKNGDSPWESHRAQRRDSPRFPGARACAGARPTAACRRRADRDARGWIGPPR